MQAECIMAGVQGAAQAPGGVKGIAKSNDYENTFTAIDGAFFPAQPGCLFSIFLFSSFFFFEKLKIKTFCFL